VLELAVEDQCQGSARRDAPCAPLTVIFARQQDARREEDGPVRLCTAATGIRVTDGTVCLRVRGSPPVHRTLRKALADAVDVEQLLAANPAARSKRPRNSQAEPIQVWTAHQLGAFLTTAQDHRLFAFYRLAAYTGARRGELLYLRWDAVNLDAAEVTFGGSTAVVRGQRVEGSTKGGRSRTVSLDHDTVAVLREHRRQQAGERLAAGSAWNDTGGLVFVTRWGEPLYPIP
jgi:integrase